MSLNPRILASIVGCLLVSAFLLFTLSNLLPLWRTMQFLTVYTKVGIWQICMNQCVSIPCSQQGFHFINCSKVYVIRFIFIFTCIISFILALFFLVIASNIENINRKLLLMMKIFVFISLLMGILSVTFSIIATNISQSIIKMKLNLSAYIGILAIIINLIAASLAIFIK